MSSRRVEVVRAYWEASENGDWQTAGECIGPGYVWTDHATHVHAQTPEELQQALADASNWSDGRIEIQEVFDTEAGAIVVRAEHSGTIIGPWRSMDATGQHVSFSACTIFKFDSDDRIVFEEVYYDMAAVMRQLGYLQ